MSDPRLTLANARVAHSSLRTRVAAPRYTDGTWHRVSAPLADLRSTSGGARMRQILRGARVLVIDSDGSASFGQAQADSYTGWLDSAALGPDHPVTHWVSAPATHLYTAPDLKSPEICGLSLGSQLHITAVQGAFAASSCGGWVPLPHLHPLEQRARDPVGVAETLLGTPYLWGGNSRWGIDCSGLIQIAMWACAHPCPGDSDLQQTAFGPPLPAGTPVQRGDLLFWRGHVAFVSDPDTILHANAHRMAVTYEPLKDAIARIEAAGDGPVTARLRPGPVQAKG